MSELQTITYNEVVNAVKNWIKANCVNITNYSSISSAAKSGYSYTIANVYSYQSAVMAGGRGNPVAYYVKHNEVTTANVTSTVSRVATQTVDTDMNSFLSSIGALNIVNNRISENNFYNFIADMVSFCCTRVNYLVSQSGNANTTHVQYLIYSPATTTTYQNTYPISTTTTSDVIINASSTLALINSLLVMIKNSIRVKPCKFTISVSDVTA